MFILVLGRGKNGSDEARAAAQNFQARDVALDLPALNQNTQWLKTLVCYAGYTVVCLVNCGFAYFSIAPSRAFLVLGLTLLPTAVKFHSHVTGKPSIPISITSCIACVADGNPFIIIVAVGTLGYVQWRRRS